MNRKTRRHIVLTQVGAAGTVGLTTMEQATAVPMSPAWGKIGKHTDNMAADVLGGKLAPRAAPPQHARLAQEELDQVAR